MLCRFLDGIEVSLADSAAAAAQIGEKFRAGQRSSTELRATDDFRERLTGLLGGAEFFVGVEFESDGLGGHAGKVLEKAAFVKMEREREIEDERLPPTRAGWTARFIGRRRNCHLGLD